MKPLEHGYFNTEESLLRFVNNNEAIVVAICPHMSFSCGTLGSSGFDLFYREKTVVTHSPVPVLSVKPISPKQANVDFKSALDPLMIKAVNNLLTKDAHSNFIRIKQKDIVAEYKRLHTVNGTEPLDVFKTNQLEFEDIFKEAGWKVSYDKPGWDESYDPAFDFEAKSK